MAVNNDSTNKLYEANNTGVKFYSSLSRRLAKGLDNIYPQGTTRVYSTTTIISDISTYYSDLDCATVVNTPVWNGSNTYYYKRDNMVEPGAVCFVSDSDGNSIFLNNLLFGDGAKAGSGSSGGGGLTEVTLSDIVVVEADGTTLTTDKTLADYFDADGKFITDYLIVNTIKKNALGEDETVTAISIDASGIKINGVSVATLTDVSNAIENAKTEILTEALNKADAALEAAKTYADNLITTVYKLKGSVEKYDDLTSIENPKNGDVYNVRTSLGTKGSANYIPPGTNYVYVYNDGDSYWDALGGTIDLSGYASSGDVTSAKEAAIASAKDYTDGQISPLNTRLESAESSINTISGNITTLQTNVNTNTSNIETNTNNIELNTTNITNISTLLTWQ